MCPRQPARHPCSAMAKPPFGNLQINGGGKADLRRTPQTIRTPAGCARASAFGGPLGTLSRASLAHHSPGLANRTVAMATAPKGRGHRMCPSQAARPWEGSSPASDHRPCFGRGVATCHHPSRACWLRTHLRFGDRLGRGASSPGATCAPSLLHQQIGPLSGPNLLVEVAGKLDSGGLRRGSGLPRAAPGPPPSADRSARSRAPPWPYRRALGPGSSPAAFLHQKMGPVRGPFFGGGGGT